MEDSVGPRQRQPCSGHSPPEAPEPWVTAQGRGGSDAWRSGTLSPEFTTKGAPFFGLFFSRMTYK